MDHTITEITFITASLCGIVALIIYHIKKLPLYRKAAEFRGPQALPLIGSAHYFMGNTTDILETLTNFEETYGTPMKLWLGPVLYIGICDPNHIKEILFSPNAIERDHLYRFLRPALGTGLITAPAAKWKIHRKLITPTFNQKLLESYIDVFVKQSRIMTQHMGQELNKGEFDINRYVSSCTLDIICETTMAVSLEAQAGFGVKYTDALKKLSEIVYLRMYKLWYHPDFIFNMTKLGNVQRMYIKHLQGISDDIIQKRNVKNNDTQVEDNTVASERTTTKKDFLDVLMKASVGGTKLTDKDIRDEINTMVIAGNDTTTTVNCFVMYMLAIFPEIQEKVYQELYEIYGDEISADTPVKNEDLNRMEYLERVIKETMRLFPPAPILARKITGDIEIGDHIIPKGCSVAIGIFMLHRSEKYWLDPLKFDPDRFLPEEVAKRDPYCYIPFSTGPRNCIGAKYAMMSMKAVIAMLLRHYVFVKDKRVDIQDIKLKVDFLLKSVENLKMRIIKRIVYSNDNSK